MLIQHSYRCASLIILVLLVLTSSTVQAQEEKSVSLQKSSVTITAAASSERIRIAAPSSIVQMHVEVYAASGEKLFDNEIRGGNVFDWHLQDGQAQRLLAGDYVCVVTVKNIAGRMAQKIGVVRVGEKDVTVGPAQISQLSPQQSQAIGPMEEDSSWTILDGKDNQTTAVIAHDGTDGEIVRGRGAFSFRLGDFFSGNDQEQMRLTEEGNLGIGTSKPKFKLDVAGAVRAREGFVFNDGSTLNVNDKGALTLTDSNGNITPNVNGTGTQNRLAKWTDNAGTLGDSLLSESGNNIVNNGASIQMTAAPSTTVDTNLIFVNGNDRTTGVIASSTPSFTSVNGPYFAMRGNTYSTFAGQRGLFAISAGNVTSPRDREGSVIFNTGLDQIRMIVTSNGNVGIGNNSPNFGLDVEKASGNTFAKFGSQFGLYAVADFPSLGFNAYYNAGWKFGKGSTNHFGGVIGVSPNDGGMHFYTTNSGGADNPATITERMGITASGNVGIGTTNPQSLLDVGGNINTSTQYNIGGNRVLSVPGSGSTIVGVNAGALTTLSGDNNSFFGASAGFFNQIGCCNAFFGASAGEANTASDNSFFGVGAGQNNTSGSRNTAIGAAAGLSNTTENNNTFIGWHSTGTAGITNATAIGASAQVTQSNSLVLGDLGVSVAIGTTNPDARLTVKGQGGSNFAFTVVSSSGEHSLWVLNNGTVRIGALQGSSTSHACFYDPASQIFQFSACSSAAEYVPTIDDGVGFAQAADLVSVAPSVKNPYDDEHSPFVVTKAAKACDDNLLGFVINPDSGADGKKLNEHYLPLAIYGYFPAKVTMENGAIKRGDPITSSSKRGYGMKATQACKIVGYALEDAEQEGKIQVFAHQSEYTAPQVAALQAQVQRLRREKSTEMEALQTQSAKLQARLNLLEQAVQRSTNGSLVTPKPSVSRGTKPKSTPTAFRRFVHSRATTKSRTVSRGL